MHLFAHISFIQSQQIKKILRIYFLNKFNSTVRYQRNCIFFLRIPRRTEKGRLTCCGLRFTVSWSVYEMLMLLGNMNKPTTHLFLMDKSDQIIKLIKLLSLYMSKNWEKVLKKKRRNCYIQYIHTQTHIYYIYEYGCHTRDDVASHITRYCLFCSALLLSATLRHNIIAAVSNGTFPFLLTPRATANHI